MRIARILYPVHVLGPGERVAIWTYGCEHHCKGCANPELWDLRGKQEMGEAQLRSALELVAARGPIDGVTVTGGDPFRDTDSLRGILSVAGEFTEELLVYTGYRMEELEKRSECRELLERIAVLIDGPYVEAENRGHVLKGSDNQRIFFLREAYRSRYEDYIQRHQGERMAENFIARDGVISVGIHGADFKRELSCRLGVD